MAEWIGEVAIVKHAVVMDKALNLGSIPGLCEDQDAMRAQ